MRMALSVFPPMPSRRPWRSCRSSSKSRKRWRRRSREGLLWMKSRPSSPGRNPRSNGSREIKQQSTIRGDTMDFGLSEELVMLREMVRGFAAGKIAPFADEWDANHYFPYEEVVKPMGELGLFGTVIPEEYGGNNMGWLAAAIITEEIARASSSLRVQVNMQEIGCAYTISR